MKVTLLVIFVLLATSCSKKAPNPQLIELVKHFKKAQEDVTKLETDLKKSGLDEGKQIKLNYEKELAKSRLERVKDQIRSMGPDGVKELGTMEASAGGGGHGGGH